MTLDAAAAASLHAEAAAARPSPEETEEFVRRWVERLAEPGYLDALVKGGVPPSDEFEARAPEAKMALARAFLERAMRDDPRFLEEVNPAARPWEWHAREESAAVFFHTLFFAPGSLRGQDPAPGPAPAQNPKAREIAVRDPFTGEVLDGFDALDARVASDLAAPPVVMPAPLRHALFEALEREPGTTLQEEPAEGIGDVRDPEAAPGRVRLPEKRASPTGARHVAVTLPAIAGGNAALAAPSGFRFDVPVGSIPVSDAPLTYAGCAQSSAGIVRCAPAAVPLGTPLLLDADGNPQTGIHGNDLLITLTPSVAMEEPQALPPPRVQPEGVTAPVTTMGATLPSGRSGGATASDGRFAYLFGGFDGSKALDEIVRYDPRNDVSVVLKTRLPSRLRDAAAVWTGSSILIIGGTDGTTPSDRILEFIPAYESLRILPAKLPRGRDCTAAAWDGRVVHLFGGREGAVRTSEIVTYEPGAQHVRTLAARLPEATACATAAFDGASFYVFGGEGAFGPKADVVRYLPHSGEIRRPWKTLPSERTGASAFWDGRGIHVLGGWNLGGFLEEIVYFDPASEMLTPLPMKLPTARAFMGLAWNGSSALLLGGVEGTRLREIAKYTLPVGDLPSIADAYPFEREVVTEARSNAAARLEIRLLADPASPAAARNVPVKAFVVFSPTGPNPNPPPPGLGDPGILVDSRKLLHVGVDGTGSTLPRVTEATVQVNLTSLAKGLARLKADVKFQDPGPDVKLFAIVGERTKVGIPLNPTTTVASLSPVPDVSLSLDLKLDGSSFVANARTSREAAATLLVNTTRMFPEEAYSQIVTSFDRLPTFLNLSYEKGAACSVKASYSASRVIPSVGVNLEASELASCSGGTLKNLKGVVGVENFPEAMEIALTPGDRVGSIRYLGARDAGEITTRVRFEASGAPVSAQARVLQTPASVELGYDVSATAGAITYVAAGAAPSIEFGIAGTPGLKALSARVDQVPSRIALNYELSSARALIAYDASAAVPAIEFSLEDGTGTRGLRARANEIPSRASLTYTFPPGAANLAYDASAPLTALSLSLDGGPGLPVIAASLKGLPTRATLTTDLAAKSLTYSASEAVQEITVDARIPVPGEGTFDADLKILSIPKEWRMSFGNGNFLFNASAPLGSIDFTAINHDTGGVPGPCASVEASFPGVAKNRVCATLDLVAKRYRAEVNFLSIRHAEITKVPRGTYARFDGGAGERLVASLRADLPSSQRATVTAVVDPLPASVSLLLGNRIEFDASSNFDLVLRAGFGDAVALDGTPDPTLYPLGIAVRDGKNQAKTTANQGLKVAVGLTGAPTRLRYDLHNHTFEMEDWRAKSKDLTIDVVLAEAKPARPEGLTALSGRMPTARYSPAVVSDGEFAYVLGGYSHPPSSSTRVWPTEILRYDWRADTFTTLPSRLPYGRSPGFGVRVGGDIFIFGGHEPTPGDPGTLRHATDIVRFNISTGKVTRMETSHAWFGGIGEAHEGKIYLIGGTKAGVTTNQILEYDPATDTIRAMKSRTVYGNMHFVSSFTDGKHIYLFGGTTICCACSCPTTFDFITKYDPVLDTIEILPDRLPFPGSAAIWSGRYGYVLASGSNRDEIVRFDPLTGKYVRLEQRLTGAKVTYEGFWDGTSAYFFPAGVTHPFVWKYTPAAPPQRVEARLHLRDAAPGDGASQSVTADFNPTETWRALDYAYHAGARFTSTHPMGPLNGTVIAGDHQVFLEVSRIPASFDVRVTFASPNMSVRSTTSEPIGSIRIGYAKNPTPTTSLNASVHLQDVPASVQLTLGRNAIGPDLVYAASESTLDVTASIDPSLFGGDASARLVAAIQDLGASFSASMVPGPETTRSIPDTSTSNPCDEITIPERKGLLQLKSSPPTGMIYLTVWGRLDARAYPVVSTSGVFCPISVGVFPRLHYDFTLNLRGQVEELRTYVTHLEELTIRPGFPLKASGRYDELSIGWDKTSLAFSSSGSVGIDLCLRLTVSGVAIDGCANNVLSMPLGVNLPAYTGDLFFHKANVHVGPAISFPCVPITFVQVRTTFYFSPHPHGEDENGFHVRGEGYGDEGEGDATWYAFPFVATPFLGRSLLPGWAAAALFLIRADSADRAVGIPIPEFC